MKRLFLAVALLGGVLRAADVPTNQILTIDTLSVTVTTFPNATPFTAPMEAPPDLRLFGLMISAKSSDPNVAKYLVWASVETVSGNRYTLRGEAVAGADWTTIVASHKGGETVSRVLRLKVVAVP